MLRPCLQNCHGAQLTEQRSSYEKDPSIAFVDKGEHFYLYLQTDDAAATADALKRNGVRLVKDVHDTACGTRELVIKDDQGHTLYFGASMSDPETAEAATIWLRPLGF